MTNVVGILQGVLWPTIWTTILIGIPLGFYLALLAGKQVGYVGRLIPHPIRLVRGQWLCPKCYGSGRDGDLTCFFCLRDVMMGFDQGWVSRKHLFRDWQWRSWTRKPVYYYPTAHDAR